MRPDGRAWLGLSVLLAAAALAAWPLPAAPLEWQPALAWREPWRVLTAAVVHYSALHLMANLAGLALVAALGWRASLPAAAALAWALAWPLTQLGLLGRPELLRYGGLSGVLHAGVVVAALYLIAGGQGRPRWVGGAVLAGLLAKLALEAPFGPVLQYRTGWDIAIAPFAHVSGAAAGLLCALLLLLLPTRPHA